MTEKCTHWVSLEDAAKTLKTTKVHLLMMVKRGMIKAREVDGEWRVDPASIVGQQRSGEVFKPHRCSSQGSCGGCQ